MLNFSLNLTWDTANNQWQVISTDFGELPGDSSPENVTSIHTMNMAYSQIIKIFEVLDSAIAVKTINIIPGVPVGNSVTGTILS